MGYSFFVSDFQSRHCEARCMGRGNLQLAKALRLLRFARNDGGYCIQGRFDYEVFDT